jgi:hypothetical protein
VESFFYKIGKNTTAASSMRLLFIKTKPRNC